MSDTTNEQKLREALRDVLENGDCSRPAFKRAAKVLQETEPKHAAEVAFGEWWMTKFEKDGYQSIYHDVFRAAAMHFYKLGLKLAETLPCSCQKSCSIHRAIADAASKVPE